MEKGDARAARPLRKDISVPGEGHAGPGGLLLAAAVLAVAHLGANLVAVYTMAEHSERIVEADLRPLLYAERLMDSRAKTRRNLLRVLAAGSARSTARTRGSWRSSSSTGWRRTASPPRPPAPS